MTVEELKELGIPLKTYTDTDALYVDSALDWILDNTTLEFDKDNIEQVKALPSGTKLFISKFIELMTLPIGISSESVDGLSQSFSDSLKNDTLMQYAKELLGVYMKSDIQFVSAKSKWREAPWL